MTDDKLRAEFETWASQHGRLTTRDGDNYFSV
jgi:hypothetical protein